MWVNTEGYFELDDDKVTLKNRCYYEQIYQAILKVNRKYEATFELIGMGLETDFYSCENIVDIIQNSRHMTVWIINSNIEIDRVLEGFKKRKIDGMNGDIFEKIK